MVELHTHIDERLELVLTHILVMTWVGIQYIHRSMLQLPDAVEEYHKWWYHSGVWVRCVCVSLCLCVSVSVCLCVSVCVCSIYM